MSNDEKIQLIHLLDEHGYNVISMYEDRSHSSSIGNEKNMHNDIELTIAKKES